MILDVPIAVDHYSSINYEVGAINRNRKQAQSRPYPRVMSVKILGILFSELLQI